ncbi:hypothetical protein ABZP36_004897 [Zizania latifolia]
MEPAGQLDVDKLTYEIFSILESKFLFGYDDPKLVFSGRSSPQGTAAVKGTPVRGPAAVEHGKVCVLSIDGGGRAADGLLAGAALVRLEASLRRRTGDKEARLADFFDVAAGSGAGGVLAAMLVARGADGRSLFSAEDALAFLMRSLRRGWSGGGLGSPLRALFRRSGAAFRKVFGDLTLRDTVRPVLVPCYDLASAGPFLFSRADAVETPAYDFRLRDVCAATCAGSDGSASACEPRPAAGSASTSEIVRIAAEGVADMVDQAVAMAFGHNRTNNYIRIQAMGSPRASRGAAKCIGGGGNGAGSSVAEEMLSQKNVESVLFRGKKLAEQTNADKLEWFAHELAKERDRRRTSALAPAVVKQQPSEAAAGHLPPTSYSNLVSQMFTSIL